MQRNLRQTALNLRAPAGLIVLTSLIFTLAGCGAPEQGTISLASYGASGPTKQRASIAAGMPDGVSPVVLARALGQNTRPTLARRARGGAR